MFHSTTVKLTGIYLGILFVICLLFSVLLYNRLAGELTNNYVAQTDFFSGQARLQPFIRDPDVLDFRSDQLTRGKQHIFFEILYIDIILLGSGGIASYFLARKTLKPIEEAHEAQTRFTADASHELRTPLATMQTEIEVALRDPKFNLTESKQLLHSNLEEIGTLRQLTTSLLTLARGSESTTRNATVLLQPVVDEALERTSKLASAESLHIQVTIPSKLTVQVDQAQLSEILVILLDNAIKYSPTKKNIQLAATTTADSAVITITDHGIGIAKKDLPHIFERFYRGDNARTKSKQNGHGLGLAIAKQMTDKLGGTIQLASSQTKGTTVTLTLPYSQQQ